MLPFTQSFFSLTLCVRRIHDGKVTFHAAFPFKQFEMNGLTLAAVTNGKNAAPDNAAAVAAVTLFGPGIIEIN